MQLTHGRLFWLVVKALLVINAALASIPARATDANDTLQIVFSTAETGFDPQALSDNYSWVVANSIFDAPYKYDYFARPLRIVPNTASAMPEITEGGRTYTIRIRPGIYFADDPVFKGKRRELTAEDYVFSYKRILDPKVRAPFLYLFENRLLGLADVLSRARKDGQLDYRARIEGLEALDRYTLRIRFNEPYYGFQYWLAMIPFAAVAREVIEGYQDASRRVMENPVGTGPYRLAEWRRSQRIVLEANPNFRDDVYPTPPAGSSPSDLGIAKGLSGRRLPLTRRVEISIVEEGQARLLGLRSGQFDYLEVSSDSIANVLDGDVLRPEYAKKGVALHRTIDQSLSYTFFNMEDPGIGGYTPEKVALRRAIVMAYDRDADIRVLRNGQAVLATQLVPPLIPGYDSGRRSDNRFDPAGARALLERFGYKAVAGDPYRRTPEGRPLLLTMASTPDSSSRQSDELWKRSLDAIGIKVAFYKQKWPELSKMAGEGKLQMWRLSIGAGIPDGDLFYAILYSGNIGAFNHARFRLPDYDHAYEESRRLPDGPARFAEFKRMDALVEAYAPLMPQSYRFQNLLVQPWLKGYKANPFSEEYWYYAIERP